MTTHRIRAADAVVRRPHAAGCRHAVGMPGGEVLTLLDALERAGIRFVLARHENAADFMAEASWHRTGAPGILVVTLEPGLLNGVNAIANAHQDCMLLIVLAGCVDAAEAETCTRQVLDQLGGLAPTTKARSTIATEGRMGPVHVDVPVCIADSPVPAEAPATRARAAATAPAGDAATTRTWLAEAERPAMVAGVDAMNERAKLATAAFCKRHGVPLITSCKAKGRRPEDHPLALWGAGLSPVAGNARDRAGLRTALEEAMAAEALSVIAAHIERGA